MYGAAQVFEYFDLVGKGSESIRLFKDLIDLLPDLRQRTELLETMEKTAKSNSSQRPPTAASVVASAATAHSRGRSRGRGRTNQRQPASHANRGRGRGTTVRRPNSKEAAARHLQQRLYQIARGPSHTTNNGRKKKGLQTLS